MVTPQRVYDYMQRRGIELARAFNPENMIYTNKESTSYRVKFVEDDLIMTCSGTLALGLCYVDKKEMIIAISRPLREVIATFVHEAHHADHETASEEEVRTLTRITLRKINFTDREYQRWLNRGIERYVLG